MSLEERNMMYCNKRHKNVVNTSRPMLRWVRIFILIARNELSFFQASTFFSRTGKMFSFSSFSPTFSSLYIFKILAWLIKDMSPGKSLKFIIAPIFVCCYHFFTKWHWILDESGELLRVLVFRFGSLWKKVT